VVCSILGMMIYTALGISQYECAGDIGILSIFVSIIAVFLGVIISLIIAQANSNYATAVADATLEANAIYSLWNIIRQLPNSEALQDEVIAYLSYIINVEYPSLKKGDLPPEGDKLASNLATNIMAFGNTLTTPQDIVLWEAAMAQMSSAQTLRLARLTYASYGVNNIMWWVTVLDSIILIILTWFIKCDTVFRYVYVAIAAIYVAASLFALTIISYPFRGYNALHPIPFEQAYNDIMGLPPKIFHIPPKNCGMDHHDNWTGMPRDGTRPPAQ